MENHQKRSVLGQQEIGGGAALLLFASGFVELRDEYDEFCRSVAGTRRAEVHAR